MLQIAVGLLIGVAAGTAGGLFGIGGGIIIVPALVLLMGMNQTHAQGTSLVALLAPVGLLALKNYYESGYADLRLGVIIALGFFFGAYFGSNIALGLDPTTMRKIFSVFFVVVGLIMFFKR